ncbi:MAG: hypothetical protein GY816_18525 [Cytophagales bacterium]|nr:hypothetical protein [Cytophagales bacterium]
MENKIDRLFQDKLARHEALPTPQAWEQVEANIKGNGKSTVWLSIAATVTLLAVSAFLIFKSNEGLQADSSASVTPDHPQPLAEFHWKLPGIEQKSEINNKVRVAPIISKLDTKEVFAEVELNEKVLDKVEEPQVIREMPVITPLDMKESVAVLEETNSTPDSISESLPQLQVQITYLAGESSTDETEEKTKVGKLWDRALQIKPGEMLASIRETKNEFFSGKKN